MSHVDIDVAALQGSGPYHLSAKVVGTGGRLSREAVLNRPALLQMNCKLFGDCTFRYNALEMRGDGSSFNMKINPTTGVY